MFLGGEAAYSKTGFENEEIRRRKEQKQEERGVYGMLVQPSRPSTLLQEEKKSGTLVWPNLRFFFKKLIAAA